MMEIKLRAWDKYKKIMIHNRKEIFENLANNDGSFIYLLFTEIKDKNNVEIYKGDIVKCWKKCMQLDRDSKDLDWISGFGIAVIEHSGWGFYFKEISQEDTSGWFFVGPETNEFYPNNRDQTIEVIGNIYENPELLEEKK